MATQARYYGLTEFAEGLLTFLPGDCWILAPHKLFLIHPNPKNMRLIIPGFLALLFLLCTCARAQNKAEGAKKGENGSALNHLAGQKSPYLLQHARNPVDWYPWGEEALAKAEAENKLLVISVGYAACHWCHVMEHESFEDSLVGTVMNGNFVNIKVDREERPDVDEVYMTACQLTNQRGCGWPLNVIALPDGRPVWAGTYFPKKQWLAILEKFTDLHLSEPGKMKEYAAGLTEELIRQNDFQPTNPGSAQLSREEIDDAARQLRAKMDLDKGGFSGAPKFPMPVVHEFLLAHYFHTGKEESLAAVNATLEAMADGGIYDQLGGGFSRYSTDAEWQVPHFEKMLYDNAQLLSLYAHAYQLTGREPYAGIVRQTTNFLDESLSDDNGLFYASLDADTEGEEGTTYVWTLGEIKNLLTDLRQQTTFIARYNITAKGNWEAQKNILFRKPVPEMTAKALGYPDEETLESDMAAARATLLAARAGRAQPRLDDKSLTAWNALAISGYTAAYRALGEEDYLNRALKAATFLRDNLMAPDGRLNRNFKDGDSAINAFLEDYALLAQACVDLYQVTFDAAWLTLATRLTDYANLHFYDPESGLYRYTSDLDPALVSGNIPVDDQAIPSGNSALARVLYQLGTLTANQEMTERATQMLLAIQPRLGQQSASYANWALLYLELLEPTYEVAILGADAGAMREQISKEYLPDALLLGGKAEGELVLLKNKLVPGETTIYVCLEKVCQLPVNTVEQALKQMRNGK